MTGRPPEIGETRNQFLRVRLADSEIKEIDRRRGQQSRSDYARERLLPPDKRGSK